MRTHPLTPWVDSVRTGGLMAFAVLIFGLDAVKELAARLGGLSAALVFIVGAGALLALVVGVNYLRWSRTEFFFDEAGDFRLDSGILERKERRLALSRLQSVDIIRPLLGRVAGLAQLRIEVAGGGDSQVVLSYLAEAQAEALRAEIIARAAGVSPGAGEAPELVLATVPTRDLMVSLLLRSETIILGASTVLVVALIVATEGAAGLILLLFTGGLPLVSVFGQFSRFFGFTVADSPDGLRLRHGLASSRSHTVPPGRVQAIEVSEPLLWRRRDWVRVSLNVAGTQGGEDDSAAEHVLLPVAPRDVARGIVARILPGVALSELQLEPAPPEAHKRAWLQWRNLGVAQDEHVLAASRGFLTRRLAIIPHARTQSVEVSQGPWQRRLGLATMRVDTTPGPVVVRALHRQAGQARALAEAQLVRAARARALGPRERWMAGPEAAEHRSGEAPKQAPTGPGGSGPAGVGQSAP